jgi:hypothetical protein
MRNRLILSVVLGILLSSVLLPARVAADSSTYSTQRRLVRAGVLVCSALNEGNFGPENTGTHIFYILDSRTDLKPFGMEFVNPLAPTVITADVYQRWRNRVRIPNSDPAFVPGTPQFQVFQIGARVTKNMGAYWEVNLDNLSAEDLQQFDLLYIHSHKANARFTAEQLAKLRRFIDGGGTLWVENSGRMSFDPRAPFLFDVQFSNGPNPNAGAVIAATNHPLLNYPYVLSPQELQSFGDKGVNGYYVFNPYTNPGDPTQFDNVAGSDALNPPARHTLVPIVWNSRGLAPINQVTPNPGWRPYILAGQVGAGRIVFSCQDSGDAINNYVGGVNVGWGSNTGAISGETLIAARPPDLKFAYNLASWTGSHTTAQTNLRRDGSTVEKIGAVLTEKWASPPPPGAGARKVGGAALFRRCVFVVDGDLILRCYNANPGEDLDGDGNADEGIPDFIAGASFDEIWRFDLKTLSPNATGASAPTIIEFYDPNFASQPVPNGLVNFNQRELVVVTLSDGTVAALRALPRANAPGLPLAPVTAVDWVLTGLGTDYGIDNSPHNTGGAPNPDSGKDLPIPAPAWSEGVLFISLNTPSGGRLVTVDPRGGRSLFRPGPLGYSGETFDRTAVPDAVGTGSMLSTPTVGYVRDNATGAMDKMVYVYVAGGAGGVGNAPASVRGFWFGTKGEPLVPAGGNNFRSRSLIPWFMPVNADENIELRPRVFARYRDPATGVIWSLELRFNAAGTPGQNEFSVTQAANQPVQVITSANVEFSGGPTVPVNDGDLTLYADYTLNWSPPIGFTGPKVNARSVLNIPDVTSSGNRVGGAPSLASDDMVFFTADTAPAGAGIQGRGVLFGVNEQNAGQTSLKWAYAMHDGMQITVNGAAVTIPPRLRQLDPSLPGYGSYILNVQFFGTPAYKDGNVYVTARGVLEAGGIPVSLVMAFKANPEIVLRLRQQITTGTPVRVRQVNAANSQSAAAPAWVELNPQQYTVDYQNGLIRITAMAPRGGTANYVSASMPFVVQIGTGEEILVAGTKVDTIRQNPADPNSATFTESRLIGPSGVDNLLWYAVLPAALPVNIGNPGFVSSSPSIQGDIMWLGTQFGFIASMNVDPASTDPEAQAMGSQVRLFNDDGTTRHLRWVSRVANPLAGGNVGAILNAPVATANVLVANTLNGASAFEDTFTIIADNKRLIEVNAAGEAVWVSEGTRSYGIAGGDLPRYIGDPNGDIVLDNPANATGVAAVKNVPFARPTVARRIGINDLLVVDTGNNRIVQIDRGGNIVWEVNRLFDDFKRLLRPGDPLTLNEPTDISYWTEFLPNININVAFNNQNYVYNGPGYIVHYLIADSGNFRVIELVDVYSANGAPIGRHTAQPWPFVMLRQLNFVSSTYSNEGKRYRYRTVERILMRNRDLPAEWQDASKGPDDLVRLTMASISNFKLIGSPQVAGQQINTFGDVAETGGGSLVLLNEQGTPLTIVGNLRVPTPTAGNPNGFRIQPIVNPTWFSKFDEVVVVNGQPQVVFKYLLCDANGCYQLSPGVATGPNNTPIPVLNVEWMLTSEDYFLMTGKRLNAASIRRLATSAGNTPNAFTPALRRFLITNRFTGEDNPRVFGITFVNNPANGNVAGTSEFRGEVFELNPATFDLRLPGRGYQPDYIRANALGLPDPGGNFLIPNPNASIVWRTPRETLFGGFFRRFIGPLDRSRATSTSLLEQPAFADRPF